MLLLPHLKKNDKRNVKRQFILGDRVMSVRIYSTKPFGLMSYILCTAGPKSLKPNSADSDRYE